jgi:antitoxin component YwqK of YwqJK toxin-antitoxin module
MKKFLFILLIGCISFTTSIISAQAEKDTLWFDANWNASEKSQASYFRPNPAKKDNGFLWADYYLSGAKQMEAISLKENEEILDGTVTWYFENGNIMQTVNYKNNVLSGERKNYHESGPLKSQYSYENGNIEGAWVGYYENANLEESGTYKSGARNGAWKEYHKNGKLKGEGNYDDGKKVRVWNMYYYDGKSEDE